MISQPWSPLWARVAGEANPRFVVTSRSRQEAGARRLHEKVYCARATWIAQLGVPSASWREVFVIVGAILVGETVFISRDGDGDVAHGRRKQGFESPWERQFNQSVKFSYLHDARRAAGAEFLRKS